MKRFSLIICALLVFSMIFPLAAGAESTRIFENDPVSLPKSAPVIDGTVKTDEGWSKAGKLDEDTAGYFYGKNPLTSITDFYFAYSDDGLYFAADLTEYGAAYALRFYEIDEDGNDSWVNDRTRSYIDVKAGDYDITNYPEKTPDGTVIDGALTPPDYNSVEKRDPSKEHITNAYWYATTGNTNVYSDDEDTIDDNYGWNGDVIALSLDALGAFNEGKFWGDAEYVPQYNIGIFKGDEVKIKTSRVSDTDITDKCKAAGKLTDDKITVEVFIPWDQIVKDMNDQSAAMGLGRTFTIEEMIADGAAHRASVTFMDRFFDPEAEYIDSWGRFVTVCSTCDDGSEGYKVGPPLKALGLKLTMAGSSDPAGGNDPGGEGTQKKDADQNNASGGKTSTKTAGTGNSSSNGSSAQTGDNGIVIAVVVGIVAIAGIVVAFTLLNKNKKQ